MGASPGFLSLWPSFGKTLAQSLRRPEAFLRAYFIPHIPVSTPQVVENLGLQQGIAIRQQCLSVVLDGLRTVSLHDLVIAENEVTHEIEWLDLHCCPEVLHRLF